MNKFLTRLRYYGIGFGLGLVFVFFFFQNRGCSWLPSNRVKNSILDRVIVVSDEEQQMLKAKGISKEEIIELLNTGSVEFDKSVKEGKTKIYLLTNDQHKVYFTLPKDNFISEVRLANKAATKISNTTEGTGTMIHFPNDPNLIHVDSTQILTCQQEALGFINQQLILKNMKASGKIDFSKTFYFKKPRPVVYFTYPDAKKNTIGSKAVWYKNKITIKSFDIPFETNCK